MPVVPRGLRARDARLGLRRGLRFRVTRASPASVVRSFGSADGAGARVHWSGDGGNGVAVAGDNCRCL